MPPRRQRCRRVTGIRHRSKPRWPCRQTGTNLKCHHLVGCPQFREVPPVGSNPHCADFKGAARRPLWSLPATMPHSVPHHPHQRATVDVISCHAPTNRRGSSLLDGCAHYRNHHLPSSGHCLPSTRPTRPSDGSEPVRGSSGHPAASPASSMTAAQRSLLLGGNPMAVDETAPRAARRVEPVDLFACVRPP